MTQLNYDEIRLSMQNKLDDLSDTRYILELAGRLDRSPKKNWVENAGGLPKYIEDIAVALHRDGKSISTAIQIAISRVKVWAAGGGNVNADTKAKAAKALAEWEALKAKSHAKSAANKVKASATDDDAVALSGHDLIFYEGRNTPEVVPSGAKPKKSGGKAGKIVKRRKATAEEEKKIAKGDWLRVNKGGDKPGDSGYKGGSKISPQLKNKS